MQVMILHEDPVLCRALAAVLRGQGLDVLAFTDAAAAKDAARRAILDLVVLGERVGGRLAHDVALLAEWRNPGLGVVLLSDRDDEAREELLDLIPSVRAVLDPASSAAEVARVTLAVARAQSAGTVPTLPPALALRRNEGAGRPATSSAAAPAMLSSQPAHGRACQIPSSLRAVVSRAPAKGSAPLPHRLAPSHAPPTQAEGRPRRLHLA